MNQIPYYSGGDPPASDGALWTDGDDIYTYVKGVKTTLLGGKLAKSLFDANTVLKADTDDTPAALTMGASTILARLAAGNIVAATVAEMLTLLGLSNAAKIKTGTYTGDGTVSQAITGVGFSPKHVKIFEHPTGSAASQIWEKLDQTWADYAQYHAAAGHGFLDDRINSLDADGFTVDDDGGDANPNANGVVYDYKCEG